MSGGGGGWELGCQVSSIIFPFSVFFSGVKFNYISKEINFNVTLPMPV